MNDLQIFEYVDSQKIRTTTIDEVVWFVAKDVCNILGLTNPRKAVSVLDEEDTKGVTISDTLGGPQNMNVVNEAGLYELIIRSRKPDAKKFKRWIMHDVIPQVIRTGTYSVPGKRVLYSPKFVQRFAANQDRVKQGYFSVISELGVRLYGKLEIAGYMIADKDPKGKELRPDISVGKRWAKYLADHYPEDINRFQEYMHLLPNGMEIPARMYELALLPKFITFVETVWIKEHAYEYFQDRDPKAIDYLIKLIPDMRVPQLAIA